MVLGRNMLSGSHLRKSPLQKIHLKGRCVSGPGLLDSEAWPLGFLPTCSADLSLIPVPSYIFYTSVKLASYIPRTVPGLSYPKRFVNICPEPKISFLNLCLP